MANTSLPDLTERTATADSDLIHVNSGGSDYKQTKQNFLRGNLAHQFANNSTLTSQLDTLASAIGFGTIHGDISSNGHQTETGMPVNSNGTVFARIFSSGQMSVSFFPNATSDEYVIFKQGTWGTWEKQPTRSEITALNNSLTNSLFVDTNNKTSYSFPVTPPSGSFGYFLLFGGTTSADTSNIFLLVGMVLNSKVQFVRLCGTQNFTGTISNGVCTITSSNTIWGGIRVISIN